MPKDVPLGEGYSGAALMAGFPGQYRDPQTEVQTFDTSGYYASYPGAAAGHPTATDPDQGRQFVIQDIPGVGQVVVPVEHSIAAVYPVDHYMAGAQPNAGQGDWYGSMFGLGAADSLQQALLPDVKRVEAGMIPDEALKPLKNYLLAALAAQRATGTPASTIISSLFQDVMRLEWGIEARWNPGSPMQIWPWENSYAGAVYSALWYDLRPLDTAGRIRYGYTFSYPWVIQRWGNSDFIDPVSGRHHRFVTTGIEQTSNAVFFFYRILVNFLLALMRALVDVGLSSRDAYKLVVVPGVENSTAFNESVVLMAGHEWAKLKLQGLLSAEQNAAIERGKAEQDARVQMQWEEYKAKQAALKAKVATLQQFQDALEAGKTPFDWLRKQLSSTDIMSLVGDLKWIALGAAAVGGLFYFGPVIAKALGA